MIGKLPPRDPEHKAAIALHQDGKRILIATRGIFRQQRTIGRFVDRRARSREMTPVNLEVEFMLQSPARDSVYPDTSWPRRAGMEMGGSRYEWNQGGI